MGSLYELVDWKGLITESLETECQGMTTYLQRFTSIDQTILANTSTQLSTWEKSLLISYLELQTLCHDNSYTSASISWASNSLRIQLENLTTQLSEILTRTTTPTFIPLTSTWLRRTRQDHEALLARQDFISFYKWNIAVMHHIHEIIDYGHSTSSAPDTAAYRAVAYGVEQLMITAKKALDGAADNALVGYMTKLFQTKFAGSFTAGQAAIIEAYMLFQELHSELKAGGTIRGDPYMGNKFDTFEMHFEKLYKSRFAVPEQRLFQDAAMKVYTEWRKSPMLYSRYPNQQPVAILVKTERVLCRIEKVLRRVGEGVNELLLGCGACLESVRKSTNTVQYPQNDLEVNVIMVRDIARSFVKK